MAGETGRHQVPKIGGLPLEVPEIDAAIAALGDFEPVLYQPEDFRTGMPPRIMGDEVELRPSFGVSLARMPKPSTFNEAGLKAYYLNGSVANAWFDNGTSVKDEAGSHIEGRTPESLGPRDAAISLRALIVTVQTLMAIAYKVELPIEKGSRPPTLHNHAASYDHRPNIRRGKDEHDMERRGYHLSMMSPEPRHEDPIKIEELLEAHTVTSPWAGAGVLSDEGFRLVQKDRTTRYAASTAQNNKGIVAVHYQSHPANDSVSKGSVRVERRVGDALRSTIADFTQKAAASLILRIVEHQGVLDEDYVTKLLGALPMDRRKTFITVSGDLTLRQTFLCNDGFRRNWHDVQEILHTAASLVVEKSGDAPGDEIQGLELWEKLVETMARSNPAKGEVDEAARTMHWAARMKFLLKHTELPTTAWRADRHPDLNLRSLSSDVIYPFDRMARYAESTAAGIMTEQEVAHRVYVPPHTRAAVRSELIRRHNDMDDSFAINALCWMFVQGPRGKKIYLNPYETRPPTARR